MTYDPIKSYEYFKSYEYSQETHDKDRAMLGLMRGFAHRRRECWDKFLEQKYDLPPMNLHFGGQVQGRSLQDRIFHLDRAGCLRTLLEFTQVYWKDFEIYANRNNLSISVLTKGQIVSRIDRIIFFYDPF